MGLIVNPIAGMGGRVGLKGTDDVLEEAIARGAEPIASRRATQFLLVLKGSMKELSIDVVTCPGQMGEDEAKAAGILVSVLPMRARKKTSVEDTKRAVELMGEMPVDLVAFVGGDGTARDVFNAMKGLNEAPVLGVPSGVKMYSSVFAVNPSDAADVVLAFVRGEAETVDFEIMDADEKAIRRDALSVKLHGYLKGPFLPMHIQSSKQLSPTTTNEKENQVAIARFIVEEMDTEGNYILGPGTTVQRIAESLGVEKTVLGVDIYRRDYVTLDANEEQILAEVQDWQNTWIILSPIGRQGMLLGRGNQQISPRVIKRVGKSKTIVAATKNKLQSIESSILRVDTGDADVDCMFRGYIKVVTDYREWRMVKVQ